MANPYINRVDIVRGGVTDTLINIGDTTAVASDVAQGKYFYLASGEKVQGSYSGGVPAGSIYQDENGFLVLDDDAGTGYQLDAASCTPSESQQVIRPGSGYYGLSQVTVGAISSSYVGSGITRRSSSDLTASGATVSVPAGYYSSAASKAVASGSAGTPTATKGTVSNHAISVTPSVTNTAGYISGGTKTGTAVSVSASELVSGTYTVSSSGTADVTNYASISVPELDYDAHNSVTFTTVSGQRKCDIEAWSTIEQAGFVDGGTIVAMEERFNAVAANTTVTPTTSSQTIGGANYMMEGAVTVSAMPSGTAGTPTATKGTVSNHQVSVTPSVTNTTGYITGSTKTGTAVTVTASELASGNKAITENGTGIDVVGYSTVSVSVSGGDTSSFKAVIERTATTPTLPSDLTKIGEHAFYYCQSLAITSLPSGVTSIEPMAFYYCTNLALTSLPSGVTSILNSAFYNCTNLALTSLPSGLTSIGGYAFYYCARIALTSLPSGLTSIGSYAFYGCEGIELTSLPSGVTSIENYTFYKCTGFVSLTSSGVISNCAANSFRYCYNLELVEFPNMSVSSLGTAFGCTTASNACRKLAFADIGGTQSLAANAFANCNALETLVLRRTSAICSLANVSAFLNTPMRGYNSKTGTVYVPNDLISTYQTATNWSTLYNDGTVTFAAIEGSDYDLS